MSFTAFSTVWHSMQHISRNVQLYCRIARRSYAAKCFRFGLRKQGNTTAQFLTFPRNAWLWLSQENRRCSTNSCEEFLYKISWKCDKFLWKISIGIFMKIRQVLVKNFYTKFHENATIFCEEVLYKFSWKCDKFLWSISICIFMKIRQVLVKNFYTKFHENATNSCEEFL